MAKGYFPAEKPLAERNNNSSESSNMSAARAALNLPLNQMALPIYSSPPPTWHEVEMGGRVLFQNFVHTELRNEGLPEDVIENPPPDAYGDVLANGFSEQMAEEATSSASVASTPESFAGQNLVAIGHTIAQLADDFRRSPQGQQIMQQADDVDLGSVTQAAFIGMLNVVFQTGVDKYRIVAVFNFCCRLLIRCFKKELIQLGSQLFLWALRYIQQKVCKWVFDHGGWERVLTKVYNFTKEICVIAAIGIIMTCGIIYIRKNLQN